MAAPEDLPGLMARCLAYLESQGVGPLELSAQDATAIARQLAFEMDLPYEGYLVEAVESWLLGAKEERELLPRANSVCGPDLDSGLASATAYGKS